MTAAPKYQMPESEHVHNIIFAGWEIISHMKTLARCRAGEAGTEPEWVQLYERIVQNIRDTIRFHLRRISKERVVEFLGSDRPEIRRLAAEVLCEEPPAQVPPKPARKPRRRTK